jgi:hypothetical protein
MQFSCSASQWFSWFSAPWSFNELALPPLSLPATIIYDGHSKTFAPNFLSWPKMIIKS